eukprot:245183_1
MSKTHRNEILVYGFIRALKLKLIPVEIIKICNAFYETHKIFIISFGHPSNNKLCLANIPNKSILELTTSKIKDIDHYTPSTCYIPNISQHINNCTAHYDGLVGICEWCPKFHREYHAVVMLFNPNNFQNNQISYKLMRANGSMPSLVDTNHYNPPDLIYCGEKHGIICYHKYGLYKLKLQNISVGTNTFNFTPAITEYDIENHSKLYNMESGAISYIQNEEKVFAINGYRKMRVWQYRHEMTLDQSEKLHETRGCAIFDLCNQKWNKAANFEYEKYRKQTLLTGICQNNQYYTTNVHIVSNIGHIAKYDMNKNVWEMLLHDIDNTEIQFGEKPVVWFEHSPHIISMYCYNRTRRTQYFGCFDIRDKDRKWIPSNEMQFIFDEMNYHFRMSLYCPKN